MFKKNLMLNLSIFQINLVIIKKLRKNDDMLIKIRLEPEDRLKNHIQTLDL